MNTDRVHLVYAHGFASGPGSAKAALLRAHLGDRLAGCRVPRLDGGDFRHMTMGTLAEHLLAAVAAVDDDDVPVLLAGSSLGGYLAAWLAAEGRLPRVAGFLLIAPAFAFARRWQALLGEAAIAEWRRRGERTFHHHAEERELPLAVDFLDSCLGVPDYPPVDPRPTAVVHGWRDETVAWDHALAYARRSSHIALHLIDDDHSLADAASARTIAHAADAVVAAITSAGDRLGAEPA